MPPGGDDERAGTPPRPARSGPLALTVVGALLAFAGVAAGAAEDWAEPMQFSTMLTTAAVIGTVVLAVGRWSWSPAAEPVLAGFPLGLAADAGGLSDLSEAGSTLPLAAGSALLLASVLWRRPAAGRATRGQAALAVSGVIGLVIAPSLTWWGGQPAPDLLAWPLPVALLLAAFVTVAGLGLGLARGGGAWASLVAGAGGMAIAAALGIAEYASTGAGSSPGGGPALALISGVLVAAAGVLALLRPDPPPGPR